MMEPTARVAALAARSEAVDGLMAQAKGLGSLLISPEK
jgi:hypothetical protein